MNLWEFLLSGIQIHCVRNLYSRVSVVWSALIFQHSSQWDHSLCYLTLCLTHLSVDCVVAWISEPWVTKLLELAHHICTTVDSAYRNYLPYAYTMRLLWCTFTILHFLYGTLLLQGAYSSRFQGSFLSRVNCMYVRFNLHYIHRL
jgi:hypothetical protein